MNIVLGISGGIAAYKGPDLVRRLHDIGADVRVILTPNATRFVSTLSLAAVSNHGVVADQWGDPGHGGVDHIEIARWASLLLIAPATANIIAKLAAGIADDALTTYALAHRGQVAIAPAMNTFMLGHPTVHENLDRLKGRGVVVIEPDSGLLACGDEGAGRMPDPEVIAAQVRGLFASRDLEGKRVLVTAGPTREPIDPVRFLTNRSSGKMGYALAGAAAQRGAVVTLVSGPTALASPSGVSLVQITTAAEMHRVVTDLAPEHDVLIMAAAVSDFTFDAAPAKIKRGASPALTLELRPTTDILEALGAMEQRPFVVAFAAETERTEEHARAKLVRKNADMIVANDVSDPTIGFDVDHNRVTIIDRKGEVLAIERMPKSAVAGRILDEVARRSTAVSSTAAARSTTGVPPVPPSPTRPSRNRISGAPPDDAE